MLDFLPTAPDQWQLWRVVRLRALTEDPAAFGSTLADWSGSGDTEPRWRSRLEDVPANFTALLDGDPVGQVSAAPSDIPNAVELLSLWVAPEARGSGVGDGLIDVVCNWARHRSATQVVLWVKVANDVAIRLYERHGFEPTTAPLRDDERQMARSV